MARRDEAPFDPLWLDSVAEACLAVSSSQGPRLVDLFVERRLEARAVATDGVSRIEDGFSEGMACRWRLPSRRVLHARTGVAPAVVEDLLSEHGARCAAMASPRLDSPDLDPPRGWRDWALEQVARLPGKQRSVVFIHRHAVVVQPGHWCAVRTPPLVRVQVDGDESGSLLAVWGHPELERWVVALTAPPPQRQWRPDPGDRFPVVLTDGCAGVLVHELLGHLVESDLITDHRSPLARLHGVATTPPVLDVVDDPTRFDLPGAFSHDDEGVPAQPIEIVHQGALVGRLCDREGARRLGAAPGRGRRSAWTELPAPRLSNLVVAPGETAPRDLEAGLKRGLVITRIAGAAVDPHAGRTVIRVERGWEVVRGRRRRALGACALTGGVLEVLDRIEPCLGSDHHADWRLGWCLKDGAPLPTGSLAPSLLIRELEVL
jgi:hypothetical protein